MSVLVQYRGVTAPVAPVAAAPPATVSLDRWHPPIERPVRDLARLQYLLPSVWWTPVESRAPHYATLVRTYRTEANALQAVYRAKRIGYVPVYHTETILAGEVDHEIDVTIYRSALVAIALRASHALTVKTVSATSPRETYTFTPGNVLAWVAGEDNCPIAGDVIKWYVTNPAPSNFQPATFEIFALGA